MPTHGRQSALRDPELKRLRAIAMVRDRVVGLSYDELATKYRMTKFNVRKVLTYARRANIIVSEGDTILEEMIPLGKQAIIAALKASDDEVDKLAKANIGIKLYEGVGLLGNKGKPSGAGSDDDDLMREMHLLRQKAAELEGTVEGDVREIQSAGSSPAGFIEGSQAGVGLESAAQQEAADGPGPEADQPSAPARPAPKDGEADELSGETLDLLRGTFGG